MAIYRIVMGQAVVMNRFGGSGHSLFTGGGSDDIIRACSAIAIPNYDKNMCGFMHYPSFSGDLVEGPDLRALRELVTILDPKEIYIFWGTRSDFYDLTNTAGKGQSIQINANVEELKDYIHTRLNSKIVINPGEDLSAKPTRRQRYPYAAVKGLAQVWFSGSASGASSSSSSSSGRELKYQLENNTYDESRLKVDLSEMRARQSVGPVSIIKSADGVPDLPPGPVVWGMHVQGPGPIAGPASSSS